MLPTPSAIRAVLAGLCVAGCTTIYQPGQPAVTTLSSPLGGQYVFAAVPPPPAVERPLVVPSGDALPVPSELTATEGWSGNYNGWAAMINAKPGVCAYRSRITNFRVSGNLAQFGGFRGRIRPDGSVQMIYGTSSIVGEFRGPHFQGQVATAACVYIMTLDKT